MAESKMNKVGYGQLEPNRLTAQTTKEVYAQLPADSGLTVIENGMALVYDQVAQKVKAPSAKGKGLVGLVYNEIILEDERYQQDCDYAMMAKEATPYQVAIDAYPRIFGLHVGDTFTTNTVKISDTHEDGSTPVPAGAKFVADTDGYWIQSTDVTGAQVVAECVKDYTLPDGQRALKLVITGVDTAPATE